MGAGTWNRQSFVNYSASKGMSVNNGAIVGNYNVQDMFVSRNLDTTLNPKNVTRECCDSLEHPDVIPVILALDVTGSMGSAAMEVAKKLNLVMTDLYDRMKDVEFMIMGIGDLAYDHAPIQASQFESDIRIAEQLDKVFFESGGGGNGFESYTAAWYFALNHTNIDAILKRNKKGIIITLGDEPINPYLPCKPLKNACGLNQSNRYKLFDVSLEEDIETKALYETVDNYFELYHIHVDHDSNYYGKRATDSFANVIGKNRVVESTIDMVPDNIVNIVLNNANHNIK